MTFSWIRTFEASSLIQRLCGHIKHFICFFLFLGHSVGETLHIYVSGYWLTATVNRLACNRRTDTQTEVKILPRLLGGVTKKNYSAKLVCMCMCVCYMVNVIFKMMIRGPAISKPTDRNPFLFAAIIIWRVITGLELDMFGMYMLVVEMIYHRSPLFQHELAISIRSGFCRPIQVI